MHFDPIVEEFFETRPELWLEILSFEQRRGLQLVKKITKDKDAVNFISWINEVRFGLFFDQLCDEIKNEVLMNGQRPDWLVTVNGQKILAEVLRINTKDAEFRANIDESRTMRKFEKENPGVPVMTMSHAKWVSLSDLGGGQYKMMRKEEKYRDIICDQHLPFIICVAPELGTFLNELDFHDFLMGKHGFFANQAEFGQHVTGVLLNSYFGQWFYYPNEHATYQLSERNQQVLDRWRY